MDRVVLLAGLYGRMLSRDSVALKQYIARILCSLPSALGCSEVVGTNGRLVTGLTWPGYRVTRPVDLSPIRL